MGSCEYNNIDVFAKSAEIGCVLKKNYRSSGYMTEALSGVIEYGFSHMQLADIRVNIKKDNVSSIKLFKRLSFTPYLDSALDFPVDILRFKRSRTDAGL